MVRMYMCRLQYTQFTQKHNYIKINKIIKERNPRNTVTLIVRNRSWHVFVVAMFSLSTSSNCGNSISSLKGRLKFGAFGGADQEAPFDVKAERAATRYAFPWTRLQKHGRDCLAATSRPPVPRAFLCPHLHVHTAYYSSLHVCTQLHEHATVTLIHHVTLLFG